VDPSQTRAIGELIYYYGQNYADGRTPLFEGLKRAIGDLTRGGFDVLRVRKAGNLAIPRIYELAAAINRLRTLRVRQI
jgi:hypothetical protein